MIPKSIRHLTNAQKECLIQAYKVLKMNYEDGDWFRDSAKRAITRAFYMQCKSFKTGFISNDAWLLKQNKKNVCFDHCFIPQLYCYYIMANWKTIGKSLETFFPHWLIASMGIDVTSEENKMLSKFTVNNASTGNLLKVKVALIDRYKKASIQILDAETADEVNFDVVDKRLDEGFSEWEKMNMLIK
mgnify:CR=1 FL=1